MFRDFSLATILYRNAHRDDGGPLARIATRKRETKGRISWEAFVDLDAERTGYHQEARSLYGEAHGSGSGPSEADAVYRAISEALERWAWYSCLAESRKDLGFEIDPSTSGFAAFPGITSRGAQQRALWEASERWSLRAWWQGKIGHSLHAAGSLDPSAEALELQAPRGSVILLWQREKDFLTFGFAGGPDIRAAAARAKIELERNIQVLGFHAESGKDPVSINEKRLLHFAVGEGRKIFLAKKERATALTTPPPALLVNRKVPGPWAKYATVWRCLWDSSMLEKDSGDLHTFEF